MPRRLLKLPRRLFGYQPSSVDQMIADRDSMLSAAEQRVRAAEARIAELEEELKRREEDIEAVKRQAPDAAAVPPRAPEPQEAVQPPPPSSEPPTWMSGSEVPYQSPPEPEPSPPPPSPSAAAVDDEVDGPDEIEEWPVPTVAPRTVEFTPPSEPPADFDPMPIGGEEGDWSTGHERWGAGAQGSNPIPPWQESITEPAAEPAASWDIIGGTSPPASPAVEEPQGSQADHDARPAEQQSLPPQITPAYMSEELANVVKAAEESATRIIERAWEATRTQISEVDRVWREVQAEIVRFAAWREHVDPLIATVQGYIDEARARIDEVPRRIQEALSPAAEAMAAVDAGMSEFAKASDLPQLLGRLHEVAQTIDTGDPTDSGSEIDPEGSASFDPPHDVPDSTFDPPAQESEPTPASDEHDAPPFVAREEGEANSGLRAREGEEADVARVIAHELRFMNETGEAISAPDRF